MSFTDLQKEYEEKKSQLSLSLYGEWVQQRNQLQEQLNKLAGIKKEKDEIEEFKQTASSSDGRKELRREIGRWASNTTKF